MKDEKNINKEDKILCVSRQLHNYNFLMKDEKNINKEDKISNLLTIV